MTPMTCTRTLPLHSDSSVRPTTQDPAHTLQTQSRCWICCPYSLLLSSFALSPSLLKTTEIKLQQTYDWNSFPHKCWREKKTHHIMCLSLHLCLSPLSLPCCLSFPSIGSPFRTRDPSYTCPAAWNHVNAPLPRNKMIHFSITAMSVWNELYNQ